MPPGRPGALRQAHTRGQVAGGGRESAASVTTSSLRSTGASALATRLLGLRGWRVVGTPPDLPRYVAIFYPHTSNWDFVLGMLGAFALQVDLTFLAKESLFRGPLGVLMRALGGQPVVRSGGKNMVAQVADLVATREKVVLALAPEGTRKKTDHWRSGFYYIAQETGLPLALVFLDTRTRTLGFGPVVQLTGDRAKDMAVIRAFYADKMGVRPQDASDIVLKER